MIFDEYIKLDMESRAHVLWNEGIFIDRFMDNMSVTNLYDLHGFFVEVVMREADKEVPEITAFKKGPRLDKYLAKVDLTEIF